MSKLGTFGHVLDVIGHLADSRIGMAIDAGKAIHDAKNAGDRVTAILQEIDQSLALAGDYSGSAALGDPALRALTRKYIEDGMALHAYIEAHKAKPPQAATAAQLGVPAGSTGD